MGLSDECVQAGRYDSAKGRVKQDSQSCEMQQECVKR